MLDGKPVANKILDDLKTKIATLKVKPNLAVVLTKDDPASLIYVNRKRKACEQIGVQSTFFDLRGCTEFELHELVIQLNIAPDIHGILIQLPLPDTFSKYALFDLIDPMKDVDCFSPMNVGLVNQNRCPLPPCTPQAILEIAKYYNYSWEGKRVAVISRSDIVGKCLTMMLTHQNATVTMCHDKTYPSDLKDICYFSDVIVVAVGIPDFIKPNMVNQNVLIYDVGINRVDGKICGDVMSQVQHMVRCTSVPGGVGPVTIACLMKNVYQATEAWLSSSSDRTI